MKWIQRLGVGFLGLMISLVLLGGLGADIQNWTLDPTGGGPFVRKKVLTSVGSKNKAWGDFSTWAAAKACLKEKALFEVPRLFLPEIFFPFHGSFAPEPPLEMEKDSRASRFCYGASHQENSCSFMPSSLDRKLDFHRPANSWLRLKREPRISEKSENFFLQKHVLGMRGFSRTRVKGNIRNKLQNAAIELGLNPHLAVAMGEVESGYDPGAVSHRGAVGVLQLMPQFFCKDPGISQEMLYDPDVNIRVGLTYMKSLLERFEENIDLSLAAYNAGPSRIVEAGYVVPRIEQTQNYVRKVKEAMEKVELDLRDGFLYKPWGSSRERL